jgi:cellobiose transport system substrate-binding protein
MGVTMRRRGAAAVAIAVIAALTAAGCGSDDNSGSSNEKVTLTVDVFGQFGYEELYRQYERDHPNITIKERGTGANLSDYTPKLTQYLATNAGAGDVVAIEEGILIQLMAQADKFENLLDYGAGSLQSNFLDWKWNLGLTTDKKKLVGLGTDVGGLAMCYRVDLFQKAGLPTARDEVSKLWPTWEAFLSTGERFKAANTGASFVDAATNVYNTILVQNAGNSGGYTYYDTSNKLVVDSNPAIKQAWDTTMKMIGAGLSGNYQSWSDQWVAAFKESKFATIACPAWMTGVIQGNAGDSAAGKWDIAAVPGGGGNWGGSWLGVPKQSKYKKEAAELAKFLTSPEGQVGAWKAKGTLPSSPKALDDTSVKDAKNTYFNNAPTGPIFAASARSLKPVYFGPKNQAVQDEVLNAIRSVEQKQRTADQAWTAALDNAKKAAS